MYLHIMPKYQKGSQEMKDYMKSIRDKRKSKSSVATNVDTKAENEKSTSQMNVDEKITILAGAILRLEEDISKLFKK
jgi:hypothetical protein